MSHLLPEQILDINYYLSEMTMFLKESYGVTDRFKRTYYSLITKLDEIGQKYLDLLNAFVLENDYDKLIDNSTYPEFQDKYYSVENPEEGELYHYFEKQGDKYVLTEDEHIVPNKTYYTINYSTINKDKEKSKNRTGLGISLGIITSPLNSYLDKILNTLF